MSTPNTGHCKWASRKPALAREDPCKCVRQCEQCKRNETGKDGDNPKAPDHPHCALVPVVMETAMPITPQGRPRGQRLVGLEHRPVHRPLFSAANLSAPTDVGE